MTRREACAGVAAFSLMGELFGTLKLVAQTAATDDTLLTASRVFSFSEMKLTTNANGGWSRAVLHGTLPTGEFVEMHESMVPPGKMPHPPHRHSNSEFILIREGEVEYLRDGVVEKVGPGDLIYTASNKPHGMRNVGAVPVSYFVVSIGVKDKAVEVELKPPA